MAKKPIRRVKSRDLSEVPDQSKSNDGVKLQDKYEMYSIPDNSNGEFLAIRTIGGLVATKTHWVMLETKDGKSVSVPKACLNFDVEEQCIKDDNNCPYCRAEQWFKDHEVSAKDRNGRDSNPCRSAVEHITNAIIRDLQEDITPRITKEEEKESGIIEKGSKSKTPVRVIRLTGGVVSKFKDVEKLNVHKVKVKGGGEERRSMAISSDKYGKDVLIKFNPKAKSASEYYGVQGGDKSPLSAEEKAYLKWDIEAWPFENEPETLKEAENEIARLKGKHWDKFRKHSGVNDESEDYDDEDEDEDERPSKKGSKSKKAPAKSKGKSRRDDDDEDEDDEDDDDFDDEDEDDEPPRKSKSKSKAKGKSRRDEDEDDEDDEDDFDDDEDEDFDDEDDEDEDEDDDFDDDDDDEDDEPPRKSSKKAPAKGKGKSRRDEDEDDEDDDLDDEDEDEDDEPPRKSKKGSASKSSGTKSSKKRKDEDDEDEDEDDEDEDDDLDDDDFDDEDEDDEPPRKSKKAPAKGKSKSRRDDDDEDDLDDDEDEDDEPPRKSSKKAPAKGKGKSSKGKSKRGSDDDDDDDLPF